MSVRSCSHLELQTKIRERIFHNIELIKDQNHWAALSIYVNQTGILTFAYCGLLPV